MDNNKAIAKPSGLKSWVAAHKTWFKYMYADGIKHATDTLKRNAENLLAQSDFNGLPTETKRAITNIVNGGAGKLCANNLNWS